jgi:hypothetical protein
MADLLRGPLPSGTNVVSAPPATAPANTDRDCGHQPSGRRDRCYDRPMGAAMTAATMAFATTGAERHRIGSANAAATAPMKANFHSLAASAENDQRASLSCSPTWRDGILPIDSRVNQSRRGPCHLTPTRRRSTAPR